MMVAAALQRLFDASQFPLPIARAVVYQRVAGELSKDQLVSLVSVLTEGAMHGPAAARNMAVRVGG